MLCDPDLSQSVKTASGSPELLLMLAYKSSLDAPDALGSMDSSMCLTVMTRAAVSSEPGIAIPQLSLLSWSVCNFGPNASEQRCEHTPKIAVVQHSSNLHPKSSLLL